ncbi:hypothetical protein IFM51744_10775 [Aspergillus udagawae]|uniref:Uncharacterized protein n=1 Tax=Aspergillus udagawae TaxID=91492 RepID=A0ABQ1ALW7_9EURO|nr:hypothetical protein IFM51744_10775 [Aspergillus udagawae]GFF84336.1 hypothetical protein IFM53868_04108 [Aspergillus udagawae]GFG19423.1 hypothetical protein IFM5058_10067 [Aspergillus udagawae]
MSATEKTIENATNADRQAVHRAIIQLRATAEYQSASKAEQDTLVERAKKRVMDGRVKDGRAAVYVADKLGYTEQSVSATWETEDIYRFSRSI